MLRRLPLIAVVVCLALPTRSEDRLGYQLEQQLKDAKYYIDQVEGIVAAMEKESANWKVGDPAVPISKVKGQLQLRDQAVRYLGNAGNRFKQLPAEHSKVVPEAKRYEEVKKSLATVETKLLEIEKGLNEVVKMGAAPEYRVDFDRLREINQMYANPDSLRHGLPASAVTAKQVGGAKAERERIATKYAAMLKQPTGEAKQMNEVLEHSQQVFTAYEKAVAKLLADLPREIETAANDLVAMAKEGVDNNRPGYFGEHGGIKSKTKQVQVLVDSLATLAPDAETTREARGRLETARATVAQIGAKFFEDSVASNQVPADQFAASDRDALLKMMATMWAKDGNGSAILKAGVIDTQWARQTRWEWNGSNAWDKVDHSRVQGYIAVKLNDTQAAVWHVNFVKNHLKGDAVEAYWFSDVKKQPDVGQRVLLKNVK